MARNIGLALGLIGAMVVVLYLLASRGSDSGAARPAPRAENTRVASGSTATSPPAGPEPAPSADVGERSRALMPPGYEMLALGMPLPEVRRLRPRIQPEPTGTPHPDGYQVWYEDDPGAHERAMYLFDPSDLRLSQMQFAAQLPRTGALTEHLRAIDQRFGSPTGVWDCPDTGNNSAVRRFTWRREGASAMDAVLIHGDQIAVTFIVSTTASVGRSLRRAQCHPVRSPDDMARFPVATDIRGPQVPTLREVSDDASPSPSPSP